MSGSFVMPKVPIYELSIIITINITEMPWVVSMLSRLAKQPPSSATAVDVHVRMNTPMGSGGERSDRLHDSGQAGPQSGLPARPMRAGR
jgi:hypothetical protein